jgi:hypothetical protein
VFQQKTRAPREPVIDLNLKVHNIEDLHVINASAAISSAGQFGLSLVRL